MTHLHTTMGVLVSCLALLPLGCAHFGAQNELIELIGPSTARLNLANKCLDERVSLALDGVLLADVAKLACPGGYSVWTTADLTNILITTDITNMPAQEVFLHIVQEQGLHLCLQDLGHSRRFVVVKRYEALSRGFTPLKDTKPETLWPNPSSDDIRQTVDGPSKPSM